MQYECKHDGKKYELIPFRCCDSYWLCVDCTDKFRGLPLGIDQEMLVNDTVRKEDV